MNQKRGYTIRLINLKEVIYLTGLKRSSIYKFMDEGHFPISISIGGRSVMWQMTKIRERDDMKIRGLEHLTLKTLLGLIWCNIMIYM
ncbi:TPA: AlpA family phage regulatory protein [Photobacterium damselae]